MSANQTAERRPVPITQIDGSRFEGENCRMASVATGLDYDTGGEKTSTGAKMRQFSGDRSGGTNAAEARYAWKRGYSEVLVVRNGYSWNTVLEDLKDGRGVHLDVWHATTGPCLSNGTGRYGHSMYVHPECKGNQWLVGDPLCHPAAWHWVDETVLRRGAEQWGAKVFGQATGGSKPQDWWFDPTDERWQTLLDTTALLLMRQSYPGNESVDLTPPPGDTGGTGIMFTVTQPRPLKSSGGTGGGGDLAISAASGLKSSYRAHANQGLDFYADANRTQRLGELSKSAELIYIGNPMGETAKTSSKAVVVGTGAPYGDGEPRPTIVYVDDQYLGDPYEV